MAANTDEALAFDGMNYKLLLIGIGIVILGFILMSGGGTGDPEVFDAKEIFSARRITVAPIVCLIGYIFVIYAIMRKPQETE
ncbi:MAG: DUF3098 domain-containing protein [Flavobacteriales bacterium]|jgi:hypothetical protein|nr:DUF3098 domain-containing protein [Flavobacteriales bacterium]MBK6893125.1 DUF3098 domain-containing protein [Flavobacteriales bacterium]MBK7249154.1 DUF3098 domain-containing protein [Flavobacteriales bacterium]MBK7285713.1 DUF3098 domain-containing protein [Flavobacteriales bacterium]MBK9058608.1 DUF3098 domain-containing protein [Flavobacteriales bacterium]